MFVSTRGIVFRQTKYSDTSLVVKIFTEDSGLGSYIVKGARGPKAKIRANLFQPLSLLDLVISENFKSNLHSIREARINHPCQNIRNDIRKSSILLFLNELLYKSIQEESANRELFGFIYDHLLLLDQTPENPACYHLSFAIHLTRFLGFFPQGTYRNEHTSFDLTEGHFVQSQPIPAANFISGSHCSWFFSLLSTPAEKFYTIPVPAGARNELLSGILRYYQYHLPLSGEFKSHIVLHDVLQK
jgi:DNA repair protein RecO (recombination protein O)